jgi:hypothetical protein
MIFVGIDPGLAGAIAFISNSEGVPLRALDTPTLVGGTKGRRDYDINQMRAYLSTLNTLVARGEVFAVIEHVHSMPKQGVASSFSFGRGVGLWEGLLVGLGIPYQKVTPQRWKQAMMDGMPKGKGSSIIVAKRLFPSVELNRKKDHGRADALLLAEFLRKEHTRGTLRHARAELEAAIDASKKKRLWMQNPARRFSRARHQARGERRCADQEKPSGWGADSCFGK